MGRNAVYSHLLLTVVFIGFVLGSCSAHQAPTMAPSLPPASSPGPTAHPAAPSATPVLTATPQPVPTASPSATPVLTATPQPVPTASPSPISGATVRGRVVEGYAARRPVVYLSLRLGSEPQGESLAYTDENGEFVLTGMPAGTTQVVGWHLSFEVSVPEGAESVDLGTLKYPAMHSSFWWTPTPLPSLAELLANGEVVEFSVCFADSEWRRPTEEEQRRRVWSCRPFSDEAEAELKWWFQRPAMLYDGMDLFRQSFPGGPNVDPLAADRRFLLGAWTSARLAESGCPYDADLLDDLAGRKQLEVWLLGYEAVEVRRLGGHYAVRVMPADGLQIIRFPGNGSDLEVHVVHDGVEIVQLPNRVVADMY